MGSIKIFSEYLEGSESSSMLNTKKLATAKNASVAGSQLHYRTCDRTFDP